MASRKAEPVIAKDLKRNSWLSFGESMKISRSFFLVEYGHGIYNDSSKNELVALVHLTLYFENSRCSLSSIIVL